MDFLNLTVDKGVATLVAVLITATATMLNLIISIASSKKQLLLEKNIKQDIEIYEEKRKWTVKQLSEFYDPIYTLLNANTDIFNRIGPTSEARISKKYNDKETSEVWSKLVNKAIIPNNKKVCEIIEKNLHLISKDDDDAIHLEFITHALAYNTFRDEAYEAYELFPYPKDYLEIIKENRKTLKNYVDNKYSVKKTNKWWEVWHCLIPS